MRRLIDFYNDLSTRNKIIVLIVCIVVMSFFVLRMSNKDSNTNLYSSKIDYKNLTIEELIDNFTEDYSNREDYGTIKNIIDELNSNYSEEKNTYSKYYDVVDNNYKKRISKRTFKNTINSIFNEIRNNNNTYNLNLYKEDLKSNVYIAEIEIDDVNRYIGIQLDWDNNLYYIFYIQ